MSQPRRFSAGPISAVRQLQLVVRPLRARLPRQRRLHTVFSTTKALLRRTFVRNARDSPRHTANEDSVCIEQCSSIFQLIRGVMRADVWWMRFYDAEHLAISHFVFVTRRLNVLGLWDDGDRGTAKGHNSCDNHN